MFRDLLVEMFLFIDCFLIVFSYRNVSFGEALWVLEGNRGNFLKMLLNATNSPQNLSS